MFRVINLSVEKSVETKIKEQVYTCYRNTFFSKNVRDAKFHFVNGDFGVKVKLSDYDRLENVNIEVWANHSDSQTIFETARKIADEIEKELKKIIY